MLNYRKVRTIHGTHWFDADIIQVEGAVVYRSECEALYIHPIDGRDVWILGPNDDDAPCDVIDEESAWDWLWHHNHWGAMEAFFPKRLAAKRLSGKFVE